VCFCEEADEFVGFDVNDLDMASMANVMKEEMEWASNCVIPPVDLWSSPSLSNAAQLEVVHGKNIG